MPENPYKSPEAEVNSIQQRRPSLARKLLPYGVVAIALYLAAVVAIALYEALDPDAAQHRDGLITGAAVWGGVAVGLFYLFWRLRR